MSEDKDGEAWTVVRRSKRWAAALAKQHQRRPIAHLPAPIVGFLPRAPTGRRRRHSSTMEMAVNDGGRSGESGKAQRHEERNGGWTVVARTKRRAAALAASNERQAPGGGQQNQQPSRGRSPVFNQRQPQFRSSVPAPKLSWPVVHLTRKAPSQLDMLPLEVFVRIFTEADSVTRTRCHRVCRQWHLILSTTKTLTESAKIDVTVLPCQRILPSCAAADDQEHQEYPYFGEYPYDQEDSSDQEDHHEQQEYIPEDTVDNRLAYTVKNLAKSAEIDVLHITAPSHHARQMDSRASADFQLRFYKLRAERSRGRTSSRENGKDEDGRVALILDNLHVKDYDLRSELEYSDRELEAFRSVEFRGVYMVEMSLCAFAYGFRENTAAGVQIARPFRPIPDQVIHPPTVRRCGSCETPLDRDYRSPDITNYHRIMAEIAESDPPLTAQEETQFKAIMQTLNERDVKELQECCAKEFGVPGRVWKEDAVPALLKRLVIAHQENGDSWTKAALMPPWLGQFNDHAAEEDALLQVEGSGSENELSVWDELPFGRQRRQ